MKRTKTLSIILLNVLCVVFFFGVAAADSLVKKDMTWALVAMIILPFGIGFKMYKKGWLDWIDNIAMD
jgi:hypothetical protein